MKASVQKRNERKNLLVLSISSSVSLSLCFFSNGVIWQISAFMLMFISQYLYNLFPLHRPTYRNNSLCGTKLAAQAYEIVSSDGYLRRIWHVELNNMIWVLNRLSIDGAKDIIRIHQQKLATLYLYHSPSVHAKLCRITWKLGLWDWK